MDSVTDLARRHKQMPDVLRQKVAREVGVTPAGHARQYTERSPLEQAGRIAASGVPLQIWWSSHDRIVVDQAHQSGALYRVLRRLDPCNPVSAYVGTWRQSHEMRSTELLPIALARLGLLAATTHQLPKSVNYSAEPACSRL